MYSSVRLNCLSWNVRGITVTLFLVFKGRAFVIEWFLPLCCSALHVSLSTVTALFACWPVTVVSKHVQAVTQINIAIMSY